MSKREINSFFCLSKYHGTFRKTDLTQHKLWVENPKVPLPSAAGTVIPQDTPNHPSGVVTSPSLCGYVRGVTQHQVQKQSVPDGQAERVEEASPKNGGASLSHSVVFRLCQPALMAMCICRFGAQLGCCQIHLLVYSPESVERVSLCLSKQLCL